MQGGICIWKIVIGDWKANLLADLLLFICSLLYGGVVKISTKQYFMKHLGFTLIKVV